jgi:hypothetical protein
MADITLSWPRLTCPALARRQAAPWRWKMSATSSLERPTAAGLHLGSWPHWGQRREPVDRAGHSADRRIGDAGVKGGGVEFAEPLRHRQTKGAATDMVDLTPPRHIPTLPIPCFWAVSGYQS